MMKYKIMHRDSVIAEANGFEVTEILNPALCPSCFYKGVLLREMAEKPTNQFASSRGKNAV